MNARRLVVFDIGSTIVAASPGQPAARIAEQLGLTTAQRHALNRALMTRPFTRPDDVATFVRDELVVGDSAVDGVVAEVWRAQEGEAVPFPGAQEVLSRLWERGLRLALLSNIWEPYVRSVWRHFGPIFERTVPPELRLFSCREGMMKPDAGLFGRLLDAAGVAAEDVVMVGDSYVIDVAPAIEFGLKTMWVLQRPEREVDSLVAVVNGAVAPPTRAVASIASVDGDLVESLWAPVPHGVVAR